MKELKKVIEKVIELFPGHAIDLSESLELLKDTIGETISATNVEIGGLAQKRNYMQINDYQVLGEQLDLYERQVDQLIELLSIEEDLDVIEDEIEEEKRKIPNYDAYVVDSHTEHTLYKDFTHKRPAGFKLNDEMTIEVATWKEMLINVCEILYHLDQEKIKEFTDLPEMNGRRKKHFSLNSSDLRKAYRIEDFYVETNLNSNAIRNLIIKMLKKYDFKISNFKVFLRADYTELHN